MAHVISLSRDDHWWLASDRMFVEGQTLVLSHPIRQLNLKKSIRNC